MRQFTYAIDRSYGEYSFGMNATLSNVSVAFSVGDGGETLRATYAAVGCGAWDCSDFALRAHSPHSKKPNNSSLAILLLASSAFPAKSAPSSTRSQRRTRYWYGLTKSSTFAATAAPTTATFSSWSTRC